MAGGEEAFKAAINKKKIPVLTLDYKWHQLMAKIEPDKRISRLENELNALLKKQGKATTDMKEIKKLKKRLMEEIMTYADEAINAGDKKAENKLAENRRLINECNEKLEQYEDELIDLPGKIDKINKELMLHTMEICYSVLGANSREIEETEKWATQIRIELKKRLVRKQEKEQWNQELYSYMHDIFGADVIDMFDTDYSKRKD